MFARHNRRWWHACFLLHPLRGRERRYRLGWLTRHARPRDLPRFLRLRLDLLRRTLLLRMLLILSRQLAAADRQTLHALLDALDLAGAARRGISIALVAARRLIVILVLGPPRRAPRAKVAVAVEVVERGLTERAETTAGR